MEVPTESIDKSLLEFNNLLSPATFPRRGDEDRNDLDFFAMVTLQRIGSIDGYSR